jgi:hypothetical protein
MAYSIFFVPSIFRAFVIRFAFGFAMDSPA